MSASHLERFKDPKVREVESKKFSDWRELPGSRTVISENMTRLYEDPAERKKQRDAHLKLYKDPEERLKLSRGQRASYELKPARREERSESQSRIISSGRAFKIRGYFNSIKGPKTHYRSSLELKVMRFLDKCPLVASWTYEQLTIRLSHGRRTTPDFLVEMIDGSRFIVEAKGKHLIKGFVISGKIDRILRWCTTNHFQYRIVTDRKCDLRILNDDLFSEIPSDHRYDS
jgi:hypothetical protein